MKKGFHSLLHIFCIIGLFTSSILVEATEKNCYSQMSEVLACFMQYNDGAYRYEFVSENKDNPDITIATYILYSQNWPIKKHINIPTTTWRHKLVFYIPKQISYTKALVYVTGGYNRSKNGVEEFKIRYKMTRDWINENNEIINIHEREIVITTKGYCI